MTSVLVILYGRRPVPTSQDLARMSGGGAYFLLPVMESMVSDTVSDADWR